MARPTRTGSRRKIRPASIGSPSAATRERGFALLIVLWTLVLIAFVVGRLTGAGTTEIRIAGNLAANAAARAAADGAIYQAIFELSGPEPQSRWALDGTPHEMTIGPSRIIVRVENEAMRVNPNLASPSLVAALLQVLGDDPQQAANLAAAIAEWVGKPVEPGALPRAEPAAGPAGGYRPPRAPAESVDELAEIRGMTPQILAVLRPHLTLLGPANPDPTTTDQAVAAALALAAPPTGVPAAAAAGNAFTARIEALAQGPGNALVARRAIVRINAALPAGYAVLSWTAIAAE